jgi:hypothetical protein
MILEAFVPLASPHLEGRIEVTLLGSFCRRHTARGPPARRPESSRIDICTMFSADDIGLVQLVCLTVFVLLHLHPKPLALP